MKTIEANKVKDGWYVVIEETRHLYSESDVLALIKNLNLKLREEFSSEEKLIAD